MPLVIISKKSLLASRRVTITLAVTPNNTAEENEAIHKTNIATKSRNTAAQATAAHRLTFSRSGESASSLEVSLSPEFPASSPSFVKVALLMRQASFFSFEA